MNYSVTKISLHLVCTALWISILRDAGRNLCKNTHSFENLISTHIKYLVTSKKHLNISEYITLFKKSIKMLTLYIIKKRIS
jgi:hypothetical protein